MSNLFIFGLGYTARVLASRLRAQGWHVTGTGSGGGTGQDALPFTNTPAIHAALATATHVLSSVPPEGEADPVLTHYAPLLGQGRHWLGYLSSTGVYGDTHGAWVDETAPISLTRRPARALADAAWLALGAHVFRLPGIYGPAFENLGGRSALDRVRAQTAHRILMPDQIFSRIHVSDIASAILASLATNAPPGAYNIADDTPAPQNAVIEEACRLLHLPPPPLQTLEEAALTPAARAFYTANRRVTNLKARRLLAWRPQYPSYREGLAAILAAEA